MSETGRDTVIMIYMQHLGGGRYTVRGCSPMRHPLWISFVNLSEKQQEMQFKRELCEMEIRK